MSVIQKSMNPLIDQYLAQGCGRCLLGGTAQCKVHLWPKILQHLRNILLNCGLQEELKWSVPCYTYNKKNTIILAAFKNYCSLSFFNGASLSDPHALLSAPGEHSQSNRLMKFTTIKEVLNLENTIKAYIFEAIDIEKQGKHLKPKKAAELKFPPEWQQVIQKMPALQKAFDALTPGRQRAYLIYFLGAKQSATRFTRIQKFVPHILKGKGMNDA